MEKKTAIAIDGPAAAGKSSVAKNIAQKLNYIYVDTGALYRAVALNVLGHGGNTEIEDEVVSVLNNTKIDLKYENGVQRVILNGKDVSVDIREPQMSMAASNVSKFPKVREFLLQLQRNMAVNHNVVMDGRDIATVILPDAKVKIFLTATVEERAKRRFLEFKEKGQDADLNELVEEIKQRDYNDSHRETAPLKPHKDAIIVDNTHMSFEETAQNILKIVGERLK